MMHRKTAIAVMACGIAAWTGFGFAPAAEPVYLGVLEGATPRVAFRFQDGHWSAMPRDVDNLATMGARYPRRVTWTIAFDGRNLGTITSSQPARYKNRMELGTQVLAAGSHAPLLRNGSGYRLLVVVSQPNYKDPDGWKPIHPAADAPYLGAVKAAHRKSSEADQRCIVEDSGLSVAGKTYGSAHGDVLIGIGPRDMRNDCAPYEGWFLAGKGGVRFIRSVLSGEGGLTLIDAGDYDGDGVSELLFREDGVGDGDDEYVLYCSRDGKTVEFRLPGEYAF
jgi:hypothetical protein